MTPSDPLTTVFASLDRWRNLPAYQLERRSDIFFSVYLPAVVAEHTGVSVSDDVIPELPIRRDLIWPDQPSKQSLKIDYAVFARDRSKVFFIELKTDSRSRRKRQDSYLAKCAELGLLRIVQGIVEIYGATNAYQKYGHLLHTLADHGCVRLPEGLDDHLWPRPRRGLSKLLREIEVTVAADEFAVEVVYVQPTASAGDVCIDFETFAAHVSRFDDPVSTLFAASLRRWVVAAGAENPPSSS